MSGLSWDDIFAVMSAASFGDRDARVRLPANPQMDHSPTRLGVALNVFLDELSARANAADAALRELESSEARYRLMFDNSPLPKWMYDVHSLRFLEVNGTAVREYGYSREEFLAMTIKDIRPVEDVPQLLALPRAEPGVRSFGVWRHQRKDGSIINVEVTAHTFEYKGRPCRLAICQNVTERLRLEEQLRQSQKMDAIGRLAGGIAHDFNNLLSVIIGYSAMVLADMTPGEPMRADLEEIRKAGNRAASLTRQLLTFSRQQVVQPQVLNLNDILSGVDQMLQRILGADIDLIALPAESLGNVLADPGSVEQVVMNLVVNARDAMPRGGQLTMETANVVLDDTYAREHIGVVPGPHVMLAVTDTGIGMDRATLSRIFEPFFTTKVQGKGTGLGLATVFGIVQQSRGSVWVYSEPGKGTTFKVYLPRVDAPADVLTEVASPTALRGTETILLVEDDDQLRALAVEILHKQGYHIIAARNAGEALLHSENHPGTIHLLLSDVVMPQMSGPELATRLGRTRPEMKVLVMSGYTDDSIVRHGVVEKCMAFLQKPITPDSLATKVRQVLESSGGEAK